VIYRIAEVLESRRDQFEAELRAAEGLTPAKARTYVDAAIDRLVFYAGWADKIAQVTGGANPVAGPYFNHSAPEPSGVIAIIAPAGPLMGLVSVVAPVITTGNTCVVIASEPHPLTAITLAEVMATSDLPAGVVNVLTGSVAEIAPWLASHLDVNGIDLTGVTDASLAADLEVSAAENLKRVRRPGLEDLLAPPPLDRMTKFLETKTVWHPMGL
jgi:acyl-CoA reductase-like NAD-dependent aldehyde dehydrogenase